MSLSHLIFKIAQELISSQNDNLNLNQKFINTLQNVLKLLPTNFKKDISKTQPSKTEFLKKITPLIVNALKSMYQNNKINIKKLVTLVLDDEHRETLIDQLNKEKEIFIPETLQPYLKTPNDFHNLLKTIELQLLSSYHQ